MLNVSIPLDELAPVIAATVAQTIAQLATDESRLGDKLAFSEQESARLLDLPHHVLRDVRRRGEISASIIVGRRVRYQRSDLLAYLAKRRVESRDL